MSNVNPRQFEQLRMLMRPDEIMSQFELSHGDRRVVPLGPGQDRRENDSELLDRKYRQAQNKGLADQISSQGVSNPIELSHGLTRDVIGWEQGPTVLDGHHRLAVSARDSPDRYIPVVHHGVDDLSTFGDWDRKPPPETKGQKKRRKQRGE